MSNEENNISNNTQNNNYVNHANIVNIYNITNIQVNNYYTLNVTVNNYIFEPLILYDKEVKNYPKLLDKFEKERSKKLNSLDKKLNKASGDKIDQFEKEIDEEKEQLKLKRPREPNLSEALYLKEQRFRELQKYPIDIIPKDINKLFEEGVSIIDSKDEMDEDKKPFIDKAREYLELLQCYNLDRIKHKEGEELLNMEKKIKKSYKKKLEEKKKMDEIYKQILEKKNKRT